MNRRIEALLVELLGEGVPTSKGNVAYFCPFQNHSSRKLEINKKTHAWHCWVCDVKKGHSLFSLLKQMGVDNSYYEVLRKELDIQSYHRPIQTFQKSSQAILRLPSEYIPLYKERLSGIEFNYIYSYLEKRGISMDLLQQYKIGACTTGEYHDRIIIPSFSKSGNLNYFIARSYRSHVEPKYKNPPISRNVVMFDNLLNFDLDLTIVEGSFDAITVGNNTTFLSGLNLLPALKSRILSGKGQKVNVIFDHDIGKAGEDLRNINRTELIEWIHSIGKYPYVVKLPPGKDPNEIGQKDMLKLIHNATPYRYEDMLKYKIMDLWNV